MFDGSSDEMSSDHNDSDYDWGSGGEHGDGWGQGFGEEDGFDSDESKKQVTESMVLESFEILGLNLTIELTAKNSLKNIVLL